MMTPENDYIKPVETLSNVGSLTPIDKHPQKRRRQEQHRNSTSQQNIPEDGQDETAGSQISRTKTGSVDYRA
jgi:hypothetical protein